MSGKRVSLWYQPKLPKAQVLAQELTEFLQGNGHVASVGSVWDEDAMLQAAPATDLALSLGGDGSILRVARAFSPQGVPLVGINLGRLGFLTELRPQEVRPGLLRLLQGEGWVEERLMLRVEVRHPQGEGPWRSYQGGAFPPDVVLHALNDVAIGRGPMLRVIRVRTSIDGQLLTTFKADGLLIATPTGSTGYSLALGGPILHPQLPVFLVKAIAPHLSLAAPIVYPATVTVELEVHTDHQATLSVDGQIDLPLADHHRVLVQRSPHRARFLRLQPRNYFAGTLEQRLHREEG